MLRSLERHESRRHAAARGRRRGFCGGFHPDGKRLAVFSAPSGSYSLTILDWVSGQPQVSIDFLTGGSQGIQWCGDDHLLAWGSLLSLKHGMAVWRYPKLELVENSPDGRGWIQRATADGITLVPLTIPSEQVVQAIDRAVADAQPLVKSGDGVTCELNLQLAPPQAELGQRLNNTLQEAAAGHGYRAGPDQPIRLQAAVWDKETGETVQFSPFAGGEAVFSVADRWLHVSLDFVDQRGTKLWSTGTHFGISRFMVSGNVKTNQEFSDKLYAERWTNLENWLRTVRLPRVIYPWSAQGHRRVGIRRRRQGERSAAGGECAVTVSQSLRAGELPDIVHTSLMNDDSLEFLQRVRTLVVVAMFSDDVLMRRLVLKGGNLMDLVYDISARSSLDVDFSIDGDFPDAANLASRVETALMSTFSEARLRGIRRESSERCRRLSRMI